MTANQIVKKLAAVNIVDSMLLAGGHILIRAGRDELEIAVIDPETDTAMDTATTRIRERAVLALGWTRFHGSKSGYGSWTVRPGVAPADHDGVASRMHY
jgi:hypothetical protein